MHALNDPLKVKRLPNFNFLSRSPLRDGLLFILLALTAFALSPMAQAQLDPEPDGFYPGFNAAEGKDALFSLATGTGTDNTAIGFDALHNDMSGSFNTATGFAALTFNTAGSIEGERISGENNTANGYQALHENQFGSNKTAVGFEALFK